MSTQISPAIYMRGCGDLGTGVAVVLFRAGYRVVVIERPKPTTLRLHAAFSTAALRGRVTVGGIEAVHIQEASEAPATLDAGKVVVWTGDEDKLRALVRPLAVIDARLRGLSDPNLHPSDAPVVIALGPGYEVGVHCDYVVETNRGPHLGDLLDEGHAETHTGIPGTIDGQTARRLLRSPRAGVFQRKRAIGDMVREGETVATVDGEPVQARLTGMIRGLLLSGHEVPKGKKVGDVDPRGEHAPLQGPSDKASAVGAGVLAALARAQKEETLRD